MLKTTNKHFCKFSKNTPRTQGGNLMYTRRSENVQDVFRTSYVRSIYVLCTVGRTCFKDLPTAVPKLLKSIHFILQKTPEY